MGVPPINDPLFDPRRYQEDYLQRVRPPRGGGPPDMSQEIQRHMLQLMEQGLSEREAYEALYRGPYRAFMPEPQSPLRRYRRAFDPPNFNEDGRTVNPMSRTQMGRDPFGRAINEYFYRKDGGDF